MPICPTDRMQLTDEASSLRVKRQNNVVIMSKNDD